MFKVRKIQYLKIVSIKTGNVATNIDIISWSSGKPKCRSSQPRKTSQPRGEWKPTKRSVPKINKIDRIDILKIDDNKNLFTLDNPVLEKFHIPNSPDEEVNVFLVESENNLLFLESEKGLWTYEADLKYEIKDIQDLRRLKATNKLHFKRNGFKQPRLSNAFFCVFLWR